MVWNHGLSTSRTGYPKLMPMAANASGGIVVMRKVHDACHIQLMNIVKIEKA